MQDAVQRLERRLVALEKRTKRSRFYLFDLIRTNVLPVTTTIIRLFADIASLTHDDMWVCLLRHTRKSSSYLHTLRCFYFSSPHDKQYILDRYEQVGLSHDFVYNVLCYPSGRPGTDLTVFLSLLGIKPGHYFIKPSPLPIHLPIPRHVCGNADGVYPVLYIPVLRYQCGMGGYYRGEPQGVTYDGTFYYYDPDSEFLLQAHNVLVTWNKITACLDVDMTVEEVHNILYDQVKEWILLDEQDNESPFFPSTVGYPVTPDNDMSKEWLRVIQLYEDRSIDPLHHYRDMYAKEDAFDQVLCHKARDKGYDAIILKYMTGETRVVSEVLDTRSRVESFAHISIPI